MSLFRLAQAAQWLSAQQRGPDVEISSVGTDTRRMRTGQLFVALRGPHFDGHAFAAQAAQGGAAALLVSQELAVDLPQLLVPDTREALGRLAGAWRARLPGRVVAVTGSNGKTTTKEMLAAGLGRLGRVAATRGNLNNDIGLPLTLLSAQDEEFLVLEMGANHPGEIAALTQLGRPDVALITQAGRAHLEGFGSLEGVARAKGEIFQGLGLDGCCVLNADDPWVGLWRELSRGRRQISFGLNPSANVRAEAQAGALAFGPDGFLCRYQVITPRGGLSLELALPGRHNLRNALAALAAAEALGLDLGVFAQGLAALRPVPGRLQARPGRGGARLIDDTYNANPDSVGAALDVLETLPGRRWLLLGDLGELGPGAASLHRELGVRAREAGVARLWAVGPLTREAVLAFGADGQHFPDQEALVAALEGQLGEDDVVLIKGSRAAAMERVVQALAVHPKG